jgi:high-affinity nickel-transport protein
MAVGDCGLSPLSRPLRDSFPVLFATGMSLIDTTDNILMLGAYGWAFVKPVRKLYYNLTITFISVVVPSRLEALRPLGCSPANSI